MGKNRRSASPRRKYPGFLSAVLVAAVACTGPAWAWQNALQDPGFERYHFDAGLGRYVPDADAAWREHGYGIASVRFDMSGWAAPAEMTAERPVGFTPGTGGFEGYGPDQNKGQLCFQQDIVNPALLNAGTLYEAWVWLGGAGRDDDGDLDLKKEQGGWDIFFYREGVVSGWLDDNAMEHHHVAMDYWGPPGSFRRVSGIGRIPSGAVGFRMRVWATTWSLSGGPAAYDTRVGLDNAHFAVVTRGNLLTNGDFDQDAAPGDFWAWDRPAVWPFAKNGIVPMDINGLFGDYFDHGGYRPFFGGARTYGYNTYLNGWLDDAFTFSQTVAWSAPAGTPVILTFYWLQDAAMRDFRWQLRQNSAQVELIVEYLNASSQVIGLDIRVVDWPVASYPGNVNAYDQNGGIAYNPRFELRPPEGTARIRLNVNKMVHMPYRPGWAHITSAVDDFYLLLPDQPATIFNPKADQITYTSARVRWVTDEATSSVVDYGPTTSYGSVMSDPTPTPYHYVRLTGLTPGRRYYYRIRSGLARYPAPGGESGVYFVLPVYGDFDGDGDVDVSDFARFQVCYNGPGRPAAATGCTNADCDADGDVDVNDFAAFQACFNGAESRPACGGT